MSNIMSNSYFDQEISISSAFTLWDRGDGIGEISLFNTIIGYIHGDTQLSDGYHYDESLEQYVEDTEIEYVPVSCFPGHLSSGHVVLQPFSNTYIDCIEHLISLVQSLPAELLPQKPKGSIIDIFSGQEKFLISRDFDIDVVIHGKELDSNIVVNFNNFSHYLKNYLQKFPEINISFLNHCYVNGNIYVQYQLENTYFLSMVFNHNNELLLGKINKSGKFNNFTIFSCDNINYQTICEQIYSSLGLSLEVATLQVLVSEKLLEKIPKQKNVFFNEVLQSYSEAFLSNLNNRGKFLIQRDLNIQHSIPIEINIDRQKLLLLQEKFSTYDMNISEGLSLFINYFLSNHNNID